MNIVLRSTLYKESITICHEVTSMFTFRTTVRLILNSKFFVVLPRWIFWQCGNIIARASAINLKICDISVLAPSVRRADKIQMGVRGTWIHVTSIWSWPLGGTGRAKTCPSNHSQNTKTEKENYPFNDSLKNGQGQSESGNRFAWRRPGAGSRREMQTQTQTRDSDPRLRHRHRRQLRRVRNCFLSLESRGTPWFPQFPRFSRLPREFSNFCLLLALKAELSRLRRLGGREVALSSG